MVTLVEKGHHGGGDGRHAGGKGFGIFAAFHGGQFLGDSIGIHRRHSGVEQGVLGARCPSRIALIGQFVGRRLEDWGVHSIPNVLGAAVDGVGCKSIVVSFSHGHLHDDEPNSLLQPFSCIV